MRRAILNIGQENNPVEPKQLIKNTQAILGDQVVHAEINAKGNWDESPEPTTILVIDTDFTEEYIIELVKNMCEGYKQTAIGLVMHEYRDGEDEVYSQREVLVYRRGHTYLRQGASGRIEELTFDSKYFLMPSPRVCTITQEGMDEGYCWSDGQSYTKYDEDFYRELREEHEHIVKDFINFGQFSEEAANEDEGEIKSILAVLDKYRGNGVSTRNLRYKILAKMAYCSGYYYHTEWEADDWTWLF